MAAAPVISYQRAKNNPNSFLQAKLIAKYVEQIDELSITTDDIMIKLISR